MSAYTEFQFKEYAYQTDTGILSLTYAYRDGPELTETIHFPDGRRTLNDCERLALDKAFRLVFLLAGVSYYKAYIPSKLVCSAFPLDPATASFCERVYRAGLGEFAFRNKVTLNFAFEADPAAKATPVPLALPHRLLVPVGGGKDSIVTMETLRKAGFDQTLIACGGINLATPIAETMRVSGLPSLHVRRTLSPVLKQLNAEGALNGHVPITAILSSIVAACAILYGYDTVVLSNENSANEPNVVQGGVEVNHQYSKSLAFEKDFDSILHQTVSPDLSYFSLLRPLSETAIAARFAKLTAYHHVFRSCNTAFRQDEALRGKKWCCACPKCRFVFLALAPFLEKEVLTRIFGANLLNEEGQLEGYRELCGLGEHKPFECVGEIQESALLLLHLADQLVWKNDAVVASLADELRVVYPRHKSQFEDLFSFRKGHCLTDVYLKALTNA